MDQLSGGAPDLSTTGYFFTNWPTAWEMQLLTTLVDPLWAHLWSEDLEVTAPWKEQNETTVKWGCLHQDLMV